MAKRPLPTVTADDALEARLRYRFRDPALLQLALTHSSLAFEAGDGRTNATGEDNEQLEFLGDAVVGLIITELLVRHFPERREGDLTRMRAMLVSGKGMGEVGVRLALGRDLQLGKGEDASGGRTKSALLADAVEAVVAAIYLDANTAIPGGNGGAGLKAAKTFVEREIFLPRLAELKSAAQQGARFGGIVGDWKSALQELLQARAAGQPLYRTVEEIGSDHNKRFRIEVLLGERVLAEGEGTSKKSAQQAAARVAYDILAPADDGSVTLPAADADHDAGAQG
jgi:ribonuclease-3